MVSSDTYVQSMMLRVPVLILAVRYPLLMRGEIDMLSKSRALASLMLAQAALFVTGTARASVVSDAAEVPYADMPDIAPIGVRIGHYIPVPQEAKGPAVDAAKGYRLEELGKGLYMITDNVYQSMF